MLNSFSFTLVFDAIFTLQVLSAEISSLRGASFVLHRMIVGVVFHAHDDVQPPLGSCLVQFSTDDRSSSVTGVLITN